MEVVHLQEQRRDGLRVKGLKLASLVANRVYFSRAYGILYGGMILVNVVMLMWLMWNGNAEPSQSFLVLEALVTMIFGLEVLTRMVTLGNKYWGKISNWFEFMVLILCIVAIFMGETSQTFSASEEMDDLLSGGLLVARYVLQGSRLLALLRHRKRVRQLNLATRDDYVRARLRTSSSLGMIDFDMIDDDDDHLDENFGINMSVFHDRQNNYLGGGKISSIRENDQDEDGYTSDDGHDFDDDDKIVLS